MVSYASLALLLSGCLVLLLVACGILLYRLGNQLGRSEIQSYFDAYVANVAELAEGSRQDNALLRLPRRVK